MLCVLSSGAELQWRDGVQVLSQEEVLLHLLSLAQKSAHRSEKKHIHELYTCAIIFNMKESVYCIIQSLHTKQ